MKSSTNPDIKNIISLVFVIGVFTFIALLFFRPIPQDNADLIKFFGGAAITGLVTVMNDIYQSRRSSERIKEIESQSKKPQDG